MATLNALTQCIHRHTGGLENPQAQIQLAIDIHRHTGGLEITIALHFFIKSIHRHTGGLESL